MYINLICRFRQKKKYEITHETGIFGKISGLPGSDFVGYSRNPCLYYSAATNK